MLFFREEVRCTLDLMRPSMGRNEVAEMIYQLRIYEIFEHNKAAFHNRFRDHAARIMKSYGFDIIAMWESKTNDRTEFVYLLAWPDEQTMIRAWGQFRADEGWKKIKKLTNTQHGDIVGVIEERTLVPTNYGSIYSSNETRQQVIETSKLHSASMI